MTADPTAAERNARKRARKAEAGLRRVEVYVPAGQEDAVREYAASLRDEAESQPCRE